MHKPIDNRTNAQTLIDENTFNSQIPLKRSQLKDHSLNNYLCISTTLLREAAKKLFFFVAHQLRPCPPPPPLS